MDRIERFGDLLPGCAVILRHRILRVIQMIGEVDLRLRQRYLADIKLSLKIKLKRVYVRYDQTLYMQLDKVIGRNVVFQPAVINRRIGFNSNIIDVQLAA